MLDGWLVIFTGPKLIEELRRSPDDELSSVEGTAEVCRHHRLPRFLAFCRDARGLCLCTPDNDARRGGTETGTYTGLCTIIAQSSIVYAHHPIAGG